MLSPSFSYLFIYLSFMSAITNVCFLMSHVYISYPSETFVFTTLTKTYFNSTYRMLCSLTLSFISFVLHQVMGQHMKLETPELACPDLVHTLSLLSTCKVHIRIVSGNSPLTGM